MTKAFNKYFIDSIAMLRQNNCDKTLTIRNMKLVNSEFKVFNKIEVECIRKLVQNLKNKSGRRGYNGGNYKASSAGSRGKSDVINKSMEEGIFPNGWEEAVIVPVPKVKRTKKIDEFRPINKLPIYEKILDYWT